MNRRKRDVMLGLKLQCKTCNWLTSDTTNSSGACTRHLKAKHDIFDSNFNEYFNIIKVDNCKICGYNFKSERSINNHLTQKHKITPLQYCSEYPLHKHFFKYHFNVAERLNLINLCEDNRIKCELCGQYFLKLSNTHLRVKHNMTQELYKTKYKIISVFSNYSLNKCKCY